MSNSRVVDQRRSALRHTDRWQMMARSCPRGLAQLQRELLLNCQECSAQAGLEALCSSSSPKLDHQMSPPRPECVRHPWPEGNSITSPSDVLHRALVGEALARM